MVHEIVGGDIITRNATSLKSPQKRFHAKISRDAEIIVIPVAAMPPFSFTPKSMDFPLVNIPSH